MSSLLKIIKTAGIQAVDATNPVSVLCGTVTNANPLSISVDQRFVLTKDFLIVPEGLSQLELDLEHSHTYMDGATEVQTGKAFDERILVRRGLQQGDQVLLLREQGGQKYVVLDRVVI